MPKNIFFMSFLYVFIACAVFLAANVHSASIREDMAARSQTVKDLKDHGLVGENNQGFLELLAADRQRQSLVNVENRDESRCTGPSARVRELLPPWLGNVGQK